MRYRDRVLAEDAVLADRTVAFIAQFAVVTHAKLDTVPVRAAHVGAQHAVTCLQARHRTLVEIGFAFRERFHVSERLDFAEG